MTTEPAKDPAETPKKKRLSGCLIAIIIAVLLPILLVVTAVVWWNVVGHEYFEELSTDTVVFSEAGKAFGGGKRTELCIAKTVNESTAACNMFDTPCMIKQSSFLGACVKASSDFPQSCAGVPSEDDLLNTWEVDTCKALGHANKMQCTMVLQEMRRTCQHVRDGAPVR